MTTLFVSLIIGKFNKNHKATGSLLTHIACCAPRPPPPYILCPQVAIQGGPLRGEGLQTSNPWTERWTASHVLSQPASGNKPHLPEAWSLLRAELDLKEETSRTLARSVCNKTHQGGFGGNSEVYRVPWEPPGG